MNNNKCVGNNKQIFNYTQKNKNEYLSTECRKSPKHTSKTKTTSKTISNISNNKIINEKAKKKNSKNSSVKMAQKRNNNNYINPLIIANYSKSLYFHSKINTIRKHRNRISYNDLSPKNNSIYLQTKQDENYTKNKQIENNELNNTKIENNNENKKPMNDLSINPLDVKTEVILKGKTPNKSNENILIIFNLKGIINSNIIKIQSNYKGYLIRKKLSKELKKIKNFSKGIGKMYSLLYIIKKRIFFQLLKNIYINENKNKKIKEDKNNIDKNNKEYNNIDKNNIDNNNIDNNKDNNNIINNNINKNIDNNNNTNNNINNNKDKNNINNNNINNNDNNNINNNINNNMDNNNNNINNKIDNNNIKEINEIQVDSKDNNLNENNDNNKENENNKIKEEKSVNSIINKDENDNLNKKENNLINTIENNNITDNNINKNDDINKNNNNLNILLEELDKKNKIIINENKILEEKLKQTKDDNNKLKQKIKELEEIEGKYNSILKENQKIKQTEQELKRLNEQLLKDMESIKGKYNKLLEEKEKEKKIIINNISDNNKNNMIDNKENIDNKNDNNNNLNNSNNISNDNSNENSKKRLKKVAFYLDNNNKINNIEVINYKYRKMESDNIVMKKKSLLKNKIKDKLNNKAIQKDTIKEEEEDIFSFESDSNSDDSNKSINTIDEELQKNEENRKKKLKDLVLNKILEKKEYLHKCFVRFYYNGLYLKMVGKFPRRASCKKCKTSKPLVSILNQFKESNKYIVPPINSHNNLDIYQPRVSFDDKKDNKDSINNNQEKKEDNNNNEKKSDEVSDQIRRIQKARGLRKLLSRKTKEKNEKLRIYFYKFYRAGIFSKMRSVRKLTSKYIRNSMTKKENTKTEEQIKAEVEEDKYLSNFLKKSKSVILLHKKEKEEKQLKRKKLLEKIIFKADRNNVKIIKNVFEKYYLRSKLISFGNNATLIKRKKKRKKSKKKDKENDNNENDKEDEKEEDKENNIEGNNIEENKSEEKKG